MVALLTQPRTAPTSYASAKPSEARETIVHEGGRFSHADADRISRTAEEGSRTGGVVIDLANAAEAETSAFARLVLLRRTLLRSGRDLAITGLRAQAAGLFEVNRLHTVLPRED